MPPDTRGSPRTATARGALVILYFVPMLAGASGEDLVTVPVFAVLLALAVIHKVDTGPRGLSTALLSGAACLIVVSVAFAAGRAIASTHVVPILNVPLVLLLGLASAAALILRPTPRERKIAEFAQQAIAAIRSQGPVPATGGDSTMIKFHLDRFAETTEAQGLSEAALDELSHDLAKLDDEAAIFSALAGRRNSNSFWRAALYAWLAHPFVTLHGIAPAEVGSLLMETLASDPIGMQTRAARAAMVRAQAGGFGPASDAVRVWGRGLLASLSGKPAEETRWLRPCLEALLR